MSPESVYTFGPFALDARRRQLRRDDEPLALSDRHLEVLRLLVARQGEILSKDVLIEAAWNDVAVGDNSVEQAMSNLRRRLGLAPDGLPYIETLVGRGYRFRMPVTIAVARQTDDVLASQLAPYRTFVEGRAAIETLGRDAVDNARAAFEAVIAANADYAPGHIGLANALALAFDAARVGGTVDLTSLQRAIEHAREACRLDLDSGEAWATLSFVLSRAGIPDGVAAARRAIALEPGNWRHHMRLAYATWGDERLRAAHAALKLLPGFGLAHWLAATVHVARQAFDESERELTAGVAAQDAQPDGGRFSSVGLHLLRGLVHLARGDRQAGEEELRRELAFEPAGHIYSAQACATAWCAIGAIRLGERRTTEAIAAFDHTLKRMPAHAMALAAASVVAPRGRRAALRERLQARVGALERYGLLVDAAAAMAVQDAIAGRHTEAAALVHGALVAAPAPVSAGWTIPVEPLLCAFDHPAEWSPVLAMLRARAA